jgi:predicted lipid-binding transport protein (Tim44 family)
MTKLLKSPTFRIAGLALAAAGLVALGVSEADARAGRSGSFGSRGERTYTAPPTTNTAPGVAKPVDRTMTQPGAATAAQAGRPTAGAATAAAQQSRFGTFGKLLMGGLIGAGLMSLLGMGGSLAAVLGFILQALLIGGLIYLAIAFFRSRRQPAPAMVNPQVRQAPQQPMSTIYTPGKAGSAAGSFAATGGGKLEVKPEDFDAFERLLGEIQDAYGREDIDALGDRMTPEMLSYLAADIATNKKNGVRNEVSGAKLLQGDLSEAWTEPGSEYATVAMRFSLIDVMVDRASGRPVSGDRDRPQEATEVWTFRRNPGAGARGWELSAIQQV